MDWLLVVVGLLFVLAAILGRNKWKAAIGARFRGNAASSCHTIIERRVAMAEPTEGTWQACDVMADEDNMVLAVVSVTGDPSRGTTILAFMGCEVDSATTEANARIMAAAREMVAALEGVQDDWGCCCRYPNSSTHSGDCRAVAAVLAKARGE